MSKISSLLVVTLVVSGFVFQNFAQQVAPWAKLSGDAPKEISARKYPVPSKEDVGIPPYPGAVISSVSAPSTDTMKYKQEVLPFINLVTSDLSSNVINFYKKTLTKDKGWNYSEEYKTFVKGTPGSSLTGFIPSVAIRDESGENFDLGYVDPNIKSKLKTRIVITYKISRKEKLFT
jgi:hypothetical protein